MPGGDSIQGANVPATTPRVSRVLCIPSQEQPASVHGLADAAACCRASWHQPWHLTATVAGIDTPRQALPASAAGTRAPTGRVLHGDNAAVLSYVPNVPGPKRVAVRNALQRRCDKHAHGVACCSTAFASLSGSVSPSGKLDSAPGKVAACWPPRALASTMCLETSSLSSSTCS